MKRRTFLQGLGALGGGLAAIGLSGACRQAGVEPALSASPKPGFAAPEPEATAAPEPGAEPMPTAQPEPAAEPEPTRGPDASRVALVKTDDRTAGVTRALELLGLPPFSGHGVFLKPNLNSADPTPGSTHPDVLRALATALRDAGAAQLTVGDRSGMGATRAVLENRGVFRLGRELGFEALVLDELPGEAWERRDVDGSHWQQGYYLPRLVLEADDIVQTCNLKTHRFGGHFTLSLKNSVGLAAQRVPGLGHDFMNELHNSRFQRVMIAEINAAYQPALVVLDGVLAFNTGGPDVGTVARAGVVLAGRDRIAIDAIGVAILRLLGTTPEVARGPIFALEQLARAGELGLGATGPDQIEIVTGDDESAEYAATMRAVLDQG